MLQKSWFRGAKYAFKNFRVQNVIGDIVLSGKV